MYRGGAEFFGGDGVAQSRIGGGQNRVIAASNQARQNLQPLMLVLMGGSHPRAIKGQIPGGVEGRAQTKTLQGLLHTHAVLFLGTDNQRGLFGGLGFFIIEAGVLNERHDKGLGRTLAQAVAEKGQGLVFEIAADGGQKLTVLRVGADGGGEEVHESPFLRINADMLVDDFM